MEDGNRVEYARKKSLLTPLGRLLLAEIFLPREAYGFGEWPISNPLDPEHPLLEFPAIQSFLEERMLPL